MRKKDRWMLCKEEQELNIDWCGSSARVRLGDRAGLRTQGQKGKATILGCPGGCTPSAGSCAPFFWLRRKPWLQFHALLWSIQCMGESNGFCFVARKCLVKKTLSRNELSKIFSANIAFALCLFALSKNITELWASQRKQIAFRAW